ncbi:armadillo-type protein [Limtongia smithiae]|uniref:armadillo-type protein n=1 Tax=Limtongia smithiae TaxID=1125753 RepID=UPI0034CD3346
MDATAGESALVPWTDLRAVATTEVLTSSTKRRVQLFLSLAAAAKAQNALDDLPLMMKLVFTSYPLYDDHASRMSVLTALRALVENTSADVITKLVAALRRESAKKGMTPADYFVLLEWTNEIVVLLAKAQADTLSKLFAELVEVQAACLEATLSALPPNKKKRLAIAAENSTKSALTALFTTVPDACANYLAVLASKSAKLAAAPLLGIVASTAADMKANLQAYTAVNNSRKDVFAFFVREVLGAKIPVGEYTASALNRFFEEFLTAEDLLADIAPSLERAILRSPETILGDVSLQLVASIPPAVDCSDTVLKHLLNPLLSSLKSSKDSVREHSCATFAALGAKCGSPAVVMKIAAEILAPLQTNKITAPDQRALYAKALTALPASPELSSIVPAGLVALSGKEMNELALASIVRALFHHIKAGLVKADTALAATVTECIKRGLLDKRANLRRFWIIGLGDFIISLSLLTISTSASKFVQSTLSLLLESWKEINANASAAVQSKLIIAGYVLVAITPVLLAKFEDPAIQTPLIKAKIIESALTTGSKASFFLQDRIYTKLILPEEQVYAVRALAAAAESVSAEKESGSQWALALIYFITSPTVPSSIRLQASLALGDAYKIQPRAISQAAIKALWRWVAQLEESDKKDSSLAISNAGQRRLRGVLQTITPVDANIPADVLNDELVDLVVLLHHDVFDTAQEWITVCQRVSVDPGTLVSTHTQKLMDIINAHRTRDSERTLNATMKAAATLAFVAPDIIAPFLRDIFSADLDASRLDGLTAEDVTIWHTPEGVLCIDVLNNGREKFVIDKNTKDYATLKWEAEVRAELASKAGTQQQKKLTKDERMKIDEQLKIEKATRERLQSAYLHCRSAVRLIHYLSIGVANGPEIWVPAATKCLLAALKAGLSQILGLDGVNTFLELSHLLSPRIGALRPFIGVALLRAIGVQDIPDSLAQESLRELVTRVLYRLRFLSEQIPLDVISLMYILPLLSLVFESKGIKCEDTEQKDEQLVLAIETLTFHTEIFAHPALPRLEVLVSVIALMRTYPTQNKAAKDCLLGLCQSIAENVTKDELNVLLGASISDDSFVRAAVLEGIDAEFEISAIGYSSELWIACHDEIELNAKLAISIWEENDLEIDTSSPTALLPFLDRTDNVIRRATARAIGDALKQEMVDNDSLFPEFLSHLTELYRERAKPPETVYDEYGMVVKSSLDQKDPWEVRDGIACVLKEIATHFPEPELAGFVRFMLDDGPLGDKNETVRQQMQEAGVLILNLNATRAVDDLAPILEECLSAKHTGSEVQDRVKECAIIFYGALARHIVDNARLPPIIERLLSTLKVPSENIQFAVAGSLPPLVKRVSGEHVRRYIDKMLAQLFGSNKYSERRGAAYGLAGLVKGVGISALADYDVIRTLTTASEDKKDTKKRQGVQFAFEILSLSLGRYFEPYAIEILPCLLSALGDASAEVRDATADAAKEIMKHTTSYGIQQLIPLTLEAFNQSQWRSKKGAVELLGTMAYLDPRQLSDSLSLIIPEIVGALNDTHKEVRKAANLSLQRFGEVISNPEIQNLVPILLKAISDPTKYVDEALDSLIKTPFVHYIDAPSLALIVYILHRGLRDRSASTKKRACQIVGNMASLTDSKDLIPYLDSLVSELEISMVDPVPATRATASRALGSLIEKLGEEQMPNLIPKLLAMLRADNNDGDRIGAAQALSEVVSGLGVRKLEEIMPVVLKNVSSPKASIRESFMNLLLFLPASFGNNFAPYLARIIPPVLAGLADEVEAIRETSLRIGRLIVKNFATKAVDLLLPELERGLSDENYRIRLNSVELTGDLLFQITGISATAGTDEDDEPAASGEVHTSLVEVLGSERRDRILSVIYLCRSDVAAVVRNAAVDVWKALVPNTPRTVKDILPILAHLIIRRLSSTDEDQRENASSTLSDLVRRFGDNLLTQFLPILEDGMYSNDADTKQGICVALSELIESAPLNVLEIHESALVAFVRGALVDPDMSVREAAAHAFDALQESLGGRRAIDQILPHLLSLLQQQAPTTAGAANSSEYALSALKEIMATKADAIFPDLLKILLEPPVSAFNARALGALAQVVAQGGSGVLYRRLQDIIEALFDAIMDAEDEDEETSVDEEGEETTKATIETSIDTIAAAVDDEEGVELVTDIFYELAAPDTTPDARKRALAFAHASTYFDTGDVDMYTEYVSPWITLCIAALADDDSPVVLTASRCLTTLVGKVHKDELLTFVTPACSQLVTLSAALPGSTTDLPGFALPPKGPNALLPVFTHGLMYGTTSEQRASAARGLGLIVLRTPATVLRPFVTHMVGPLIRTVGERFPAAQVKVPILDTLALMLEKVPVFLRPFLPQLQRTFTKALADAAAVVADGDDDDGERLRTSAQKALDVLSKIQTTKR